MSTEVSVYADWEEFAEPALVGVLGSASVRGKESFSFAYAQSWLGSPFAQEMDPELKLYAGPQYNTDPRNFRTFLDSCPDRWGRLLMKRREAIVARQEGRRPAVLTEVDYLLGVHDLYRMGAMRFNLEPDGPFLNNDNRLAVPPISSLRELEHAANQVETGPENDSEYLRWLDMLISPGSSLGGARPKSSVVDEDGALWIAKFPSRHDDYDVAAWEFLVHRLALDAGVVMTECKLAKLDGHHRTFLTKRFDRTPQSRRHFTSAMTQLGYYDGDYEASYLEIAQFLTEKGADSKADLMQLWRRIVFNIAVSNTDDHLRNHGFIYRRGGWLLSPAYDVNPTTPANGLHLNITDSDNRLNYELAVEVVPFFRLTRRKAQEIVDEVRQAVSRWRHVATSLNIGREEQALMESAFRV